MAMPKSKTSHLHFVLSILAIGLVGSLGFQFKVETYELMTEDFGTKAEDLLDGSDRIRRRVVRSLNVSTFAPTQTASPAQTTNPPPSGGSTLTTNPASSSTQRSTAARTTSGLSSVTPNTTSTPSGSFMPTNKSNITIVKDDHTYYKSEYYESGKNWWFDLTDGGTPKLHEKLSKNLEYFDIIPTSFEFPYYGHVIKNVVITNKGYVFLGDRFHKFNASLQYVAPLMANFGAHLHDNTSIHYVDTGDRFTVEWNNISLINQEVGGFSFQCSIFRDGKIAFAYKKIPIPVSEIRNDSFFVRVGLSDSFQLRRYKHIFSIYKLHFYRLYIIHYLYHKVRLSWKNVKSGSAFVIYPQPNCITFKTCETCAESKTSFSCAWCPKLKRCSDGVDRHRQEWVVNGCHRNSITKCPAKPTTESSTPAEENTSTPAEENISTPVEENTSTPAEENTSTTAKPAGKKNSRKQSKSGNNTGYIALIVLLLALVIGLAGWVLYAYRHPQSKSGMLLIQYGNPRKWCKRDSDGINKSTGGTVNFKSMVDA